MFEFPLKVQKYDSTLDVWSFEVFETREIFASYLQSQFKRPGKYNIQNAAVWKKEYNSFLAKGYYTSAVKGTHQYKKYWANEKDKSLAGVIMDGFYIPPFFYFYLNFLNIYDKVRGKHVSPDLWDSDYHFMLYIMRCIIESKHAIVVKTRQRGYSYKIMAILYWSYVWFEGAVNTIGASDEEFVKKSWKYLDHYRQFLHKHTAWRRGPQIPKALEWRELTLTSDGETLGNGSSLTGTTFKQSPSKGVGGPQKFFFYEEAGIAPTLLTTIEYIRPAIEAGTVTTGTIIVSGSVGELDDCEHLKKLFESPESYNFLPVDNIWDEQPENAQCGFFVPNSWSLHGFIDANGNSLVEEAEQFILEKRKKSKIGKTGEQYQLEVSQNPLTPKEAFDYRKDSYFPQYIMSSQIMRLETDVPKLTSVELYEKENGTITFKTDTEMRPITKFPLKDSDEKIGCVVIKEFPEQGAPFLTYFAGVDPIATDKTTTSESLFSIYIFKNLIETKYKDEEGNIRTKTTGFEPVAWYTGRYDDIKKTNQIGEYLVRFYNAFTVCESNVQTFINHMQTRQLQRFLATKADIPFIGDLNTNKDVHKQYGVHMNPTIKAHILNNIKEYVSEEMDVVRKQDETIVRTIYGAERIKDIGLCKEVKAYHDKLNVDRIIAFGLALSIAKSFVMNGVINRINEVKEQNRKVEIPPRSFFKPLSSVVMGDDQKPVIYTKSLFKYHR